MPLLVHSRGKEMIKKFLATLGIVVVLGLVSSVYASEPTLKFPKNKGAVSVQTSPQSVGTRSETGTGVAMGDPHLDRWDSGADSTALCGHTSTTTSSPTIPTT